MKNSRIAENVARVHTSNSIKNELACILDTVLLRNGKRMINIGAKKHSYCYGF